MEKRSSSGSNISLDSLERDFRRKTSIKDGVSDDNVDTILVPFYEKDVLIKIPKLQKPKDDKYGKANDKMKRDTQQSSYLVNKDKRKARCNSYLEIFRKQFTPHQTEKKVDMNEIRSISPEFGDTERESFIEDTDNPTAEFYNTESYNEMYYEKLLNQEFDKYIDHSMEILEFPDDARSKSPEDGNLKSVSEVSQPRRNPRRATVPPIETVKLGGLGPDMTKIKPCLERARSLQRYSEKVRMENRLRIYKRSVEADNRKKAEQESPARRNSARGSAKGSKEELSASYLVNKSEKESSQLAKKVYFPKSKSADMQKLRERTMGKDARGKLVSKRNESASQKQVQAKISDIEPQKEKGKGVESRVRAKSSARSRGINTDNGAAVSEVSPLHISFLLNVGGVRPSSALRSLEEKHRMYQDQVKAFNVDHNHQ